jgi:NAD(P)-dependent dehydrogenase (short-subunit alcohol dehydrogenase family)
VDGSAYPTAKPARPEMTRSSLPRYFTKRHALECHFSAASPYDQGMRELGAKVVVVTGASSGVGRVTAERLAARGVRVILAGRNVEAHVALVDELRKAGGDAEHVPLDLNDLGSVRSCAQKLTERQPYIDVLINNAGVAGRRDLTKQGFEAAFGVNHLGHFLLTQLLLPRLLATEGARVVNVSSKAHYGARGVDFDSVRRSATLLSAFACYEVSKLCNVLHAAELARRYGSQGLHSYALHPGVLATGVWRHVPQPARGLMKLFMKPEREGAETSLLCAVGEQVAEQNGRYYDDCREVAPSKLAQDRELAAELWRRSEAWVAS